MKIEFHTLYWPNTKKEQMDSHRRVMKHFELPVNYHELQAPHGAWMDAVCRQSSADIIGFFDADCVPVSRERIMKCVEYVKNTQTFLGIAQVSNHIPPKSHIYAAPAFYLIAKKCLEQLGAEVSFRETARADVAEEVSYAAESKGIPYRCLYPSTFEREPVGGLWPLGNYGYYGVGTTFENTVYHLYQGRMGNNMELFMQRCNEIVEGKFDNASHFSARLLNIQRKAAS